MDRRQRGPIRSVLLIGWLVGNVVFSETTGRIFLIFCKKLGDYKRRIVTEPDFEKNCSLEIFAKRSAIQPKIRHFDIFLKNGCNDFFGFWPEFSAKYDLQFEWNQFFWKICYLEISWNRQNSVLQFAGPVNVFLFLMLSGTIF